MALTAQPSCQVNSADFFVPCATCAKKRPCAFGKYPHPTAAESLKDLAAQKTARIWWRPFIARCVQCVSFAFRAHQSWPPARALAYTRKSCKSISLFFISSALCAKFWTRPQRACSWAEARGAVAFFELNNRESICGFMVCAVMLHNSSHRWSRAKIFARYLHHERARRCIMHGCIHRIGARSL